MRKTFKYRLFPTPAQRAALQAQLDACRWVYNKTLEVRRDAWEQERKLLGRYNTSTLLTGWKQEHEWLREGHAQAMQDAQKRVDLAFRAFFQRVKRGNEPGYPRFRGKHRYDSFTYPQEKGNWRFLPDGHLRLSKIGDVRVKLHRPLAGECKTLTIRRDSVGNWYACFSCIIEPKPLPPTDRVVGVDLGLTTFAVLSNGEKIRRERWMKRDAKDIARLQRKMERFEKGTPERRKAIRALQKAYRRAASRRNNFAHQESRKLVNQYQLIAFEDLDVQEMRQNGNKIINQGIADVAWRQFVQFTTYKAEEAGRGVALVDPRGTTQQCSGCGQIVPKELSVRQHACPHCGLSLSRDHNAALNILARGLASLGARDSRPRSSPIYGGE
jgi:putative transposase